ncbi:ECF transporter S component [Peptostreptococcaceae bacterium AGR-M142]
MITNKTKNIVYYALMIALVCLGTMMIRIPVIATNGYINVGDSFIFIAATVLGPVGGFLAGGIGSALADLLSGYSHFAVFTLIVKGLEGYLVGLLMSKIEIRNFNLKMILVYLMGASEMVLGYYLVESFMYGSFITPIPSIFANMIQGGASVIIGSLMVLSIYKTNYFKNAM